MNIEDLPAIRNKIFTEPLCRPEGPPLGHGWVTIVDQGRSILVLCEDCGRTPLEMLAQMPLENRG